MKQKLQYKGNHPGLEHLKYYLCDINLHVDAVLVCPDEDVHPALPLFTYPSLKSFLKDWRVV